ncbi:sensor histidine kinase [Clostridium oryzae]|uniref:histidine kinase n=1 Tax=Clostridium oryzae TaxID=1450648 RepID=A0A1V4IQV5_9CLOT|nr:sensor histidine kinase [Clostridium oryzae]OPJ62259.1 sensor histidine kinase DesK [Clostridium oryzae]
MINTVEVIMIVISYCILVMNMLIVYIYSDINGIAIVALNFTIIFSYSVRTFFASRIDDSYKFKYYTIIFIGYILEIISIFILNRFDNTMVSQTLYLLILSDAAINRSRAFSAGTFCLLYIISCFSIVLTVHFNMTKVIPAALITITVYAVVYIIFSLLKYMMKQTETIQENLRRITVEKLEKDNLYAELKEAYQKVEGITALKERNRIAREIHDTVGHTLTTVLVELEAAKRLLRKDVALSENKLNLAQQQVRKGLDSIRSSVRVLEKGEDIMDFGQSVIAIIEDTEKHSEVSIKYQIDETKISKKQQEMLLSALTEGLTNGIRHGKSTAFIFKLTSKSEGHVLFSLEDNGNGATAMVPGFGLKSMKERVEELGGKIRIDTAPEEGFALYIEL